MQRAVRPVSIKHAGHKNMLCEDVWSFEGVFRFLEIRDILALGQTNREFACYVKGACLTCRHLSFIENRDIRTITNRRRFPVLEGFSQMAVRTVMKKVDMDMLVERWIDWDMCHISTATHTRQAIHRMLLRARSLNHLSLHISPRTYRGFVESLKKPLHALVRRNPRLGALTIYGMAPIGLLKPFRMTALRRVELVRVYVTDCDLSLLISALPPSVEEFVVHRTRMAIAHRPPAYLLRLVHKPSIRRVELKGCICSCCLMCDTWSVLTTFCENIRLQALSIDALRMDHVELLAKLKFVSSLECTVVVGCPESLFNAWASTLPSSFRVAIPAPCA